MTVVTFSDQELTEIRKTLNERKTVLEESRSALERPEFRSLFLSSEETTTVGNPEDLLRDTLTSLARQLDDVSDAEARLASGQFGKCERCGHPMSHSLVRDIPEARLCLKCSLSL